MNPTAMTSERNEPEIGLGAPLQWLKLGWADLLRNPGPGLLHGVLLTCFGWLLLWAASDRFWMLAGAFSGFMIVAPILTTGLYQISKQCSTGHCVGMSEVLRLWQSLDGRLIVFGLLLGFAATGWVMTSASMITALSPVPVRNPMDFLKHVVLAEDNWLFEVWLFVGGILAAPMFASSVVAIPMLVDTQASVRTAVLASWNAVGSYPLVLGLWALIIMSLVGLGMLTGLLGLIVVVPLLGHASWHAYCDLTRVA